MDEDPLLLVFLVDSQRYALRLSYTHRVLPMLAVTPLPGAPAGVAGVIDVAAHIVPVMDLRRRFGLPAREPRLSDVLILAETHGRRVALPADGVVGVLSGALNDTTAATGLSSNSGQIAGVLRVSDGLILIHDLEAFLDATERAALDRALVSLTSKTPG